MGFFQVINSLSSFNEKKQCLEIMNPEVLSVNLSKFVSDLSVNLSKFVILLKKKIIDLRNERKLNSLNARMVTKGIRPTAISHCATFSAMLCAAFPQLHSNYDLYQSLKIKYLKTQIKKIYLCNI